jgi:glycosyltransferase involved in cell wall biosynthesis
MKILFIHQNFPGQFSHLAPALAERGHEVKALTLNGQEVAGVQTIYYQPTMGSAPSIHPWVKDFETKVIRGEAVLKKAFEMKAQGYEPDVIVAHHGWGESLFVKEVWPQAPLGVYCEFYYHAKGVDLDFDPEFYVDDPTWAAAMAMKNLNNQLHFELADAGLSPTEWQKFTHPEPFRSRIKVIHEGVDTDLCCPNPDVAVMLDNSIRVDKGNEIITFINRNLEPHRGYHSFMRALPAVLEARPNARVLIVGADGVGYGSPAPGGATWKQIFLKEVADRLDLSRIHFLGQVPYQTLISLLQLSTVHVYLTYPFVLSWSLIEAMSIGCAIVGSDTAPVREVISHNETGRLANFFSPDEISSQIIDLIENKTESLRLGHAARAKALKDFDRKTVCLPQQIAWVENSFI